MNIASVINSPLLNLVSMFVPQAAPVIAVIQRFAPAISAAEPVIRAAVAEGKPAFEAAKQQAPQLVAAVHELFTHLPFTSTDLSAASTALHFENITRGLVGIGKMTPEQEKVWMDRATPGNDPSQENSKFPIG